MTEADPPTPPPRIRPPNSPLREQPLDQIRAERDWWNDAVARASGPASATFAADQRAACDAEIARREFIERFAKRMLERAGRATFDDGGSIEAYARETAPSYFDDIDLRADGPEECADVDIFYWEES